MKRGGLKASIPGGVSILLALASAVLLIISFPDFELWGIALFALVPFFFAVEREKRSFRSAFVTGWLFGVVFFFGTCWWLTYSPINYAGFPPALAYFLLFIVCTIGAVFPGLFSGIMGLLLRYYGKPAAIAIPVVWTAMEFLRYWLTGNNWNALGYSQAFNEGVIGLAAYGGVLLVSGYVAFMNVAAWAIVGVFLLLWSRMYRSVTENDPKLLGRPVSSRSLGIVILVLVVVFVIGLRFGSRGSYVMNDEGFAPSEGSVNVIAIQPNVPMSGLGYAEWLDLRIRHQLLTEAALERLERDGEKPTVIIFPESPMNFRYSEDEEFQAYIHQFARKYNAGVLFNSAEPNIQNGQYFNSAVMIGPDGRKIGRYDKIYLVPFGEFVPGPLASIIPALVGSFSAGDTLKVVPLADLSAGIMICFESHFGDLSREAVLQGADVLVELTNDGYLGLTPVLRQHLANAVFRAVETNRPMLRVTNVGITAYINEKGRVLDAAPVYQEDTRIWTVSKSDGSRTFYVKYGDWFAWLSLTATFGLLGYAFFRRRQQTV
jgi:apolipoprotein N-acyltransferase